jgi:hypothetical protein
MNDKTYHGIAPRRLNDGLLYTDEQLANLRLMINCDTPHDEATRAVCYFRRMVGLKPMSAAPTDEEQANACAFLNLALAANNQLVGAQLLFRILRLDLTDDQVARLLIKLVRDLSDLDSELNNIYAMMRRQPER